MIENDRIWPLWNNGGNSFKIHTGFFKISVYHMSSKFKPSAKLTERQFCRKISSYTFLDKG